jgi:steroid delta-isomerase
MVAEETARSTVAAYFAAMGALDSDRMAAVFAANGVLDYPGRPTVHGQAAARAFYQGVVGAMTTARAVALEVFPADSGAAVKWQLEFTGKNGRTVRFDGINVYDINEQGEVERLRVYYDASVLAPLLQA